ncbi:MAG: SDR family NAD(P)-dependent oxidoreductase [Bacteroidales bacterium]|jgi:uncharacterized protein|nr:SDR family NAD(P)-dependent oxidoreductase [Bacteroidales bacterium]MDD2203923.1 SDR family NAD(P)-dependent oxidoreductase [Bacteroidales bacterium]MDD3152794.1 SDR family NAD(P)-dependent oxidoreductase [Bacteroidales bacterium]MDD3913062.1 SDR family NAD(P)-dependent oxidoreductase [Bacteroidales bacterium]MDD4632977.1 SDR family NAD(P)-dependent oxidoreductase [Bacteroidales bacterium]
MSAEGNRENKTALITGASSGIGLEYAKCLAAQKYNLVIVSIEEQLIKEVGTQLEQQYGILTYPICTDLADSNAASLLFNFCKENNLIIDILISNAGFFFFDEIDKTNDKKVQNLIKLQVETPTMLCKLFGSEMKRRQYGYILITSSLAAWLPYPGLIIYSATKRYLKDFAKALHYEMIDYNVGVTAVCPGAINTPLYNLSDRYRKIALNTGIMMNPDKLAKKAIKAMFKKRVRIIPGTLYKIILPLLIIMPMCIIQCIKRKTKILIKK